MPTVLQNTTKTNWVVSPGTRFKTYCQRTHTHTNTIRSLGYQHGLDQKLIRILNQQHIYAELLEFQMLHETKKKIHEKMMIKKKYIVQQ